jgi:hypothetical protein
MERGVWRDILSAEVKSMAEENDEEKQTMRWGRRGVLGAAVGLAGGLAGVTAGVALGGARPAPAPRRIGARRFEKKVVIITGATSGIGRAAALAFAASPPTARRRRSAWSPRSWMARPSASSPTHPRKPWPSPSSTTRTATENWTNFFGIPEEGYGFSNNARGSMGPPAFDKAAFQHVAGAQVLHLSVVY